MPIEGSIPASVQIPRFNSPFEALGEMMRVRLGQSLLQERQLEQQEAQRKIQQQQRADAGQAAYTKIVQDLATSGQTPTGPVVSAALRSQGFPEHADLVDKGYDAQQKSVAETVKLGVENHQKLVTLIGNLTHPFLNNDGSAVDATPANMARFQSVQPALVEAANGIHSQMAAAIPKQFDPEAIQSLAKWADDGKDTLVRQKQVMQAIADKPKTIGEWMKNVVAPTLTMAKTPEQVPGMMNDLSAMGVPDAVLAPFKNQRPDQAMQAARQFLTSPEKEAELRNTVRHQKVEESLAAQRLADESGSVPNLTPQGLDLVAHQFAMTGQLPPMGMGSKAAKVRTDIINKAAETYQGLDLPTQQAAFRANQATLSKLVQQRAAVAAFSETAGKNLDQFLGIAQKVADMGSPILNRPLRTISNLVAGSPEMAAFDAARQTVVPEFAKILASPGLSGQLSDSARQEMAAVLRPDATMKQIIAASRALQQENKNRLSGYDDQIGAIQQRIATPPGGSLSAPPTTMLSPPASGVPANVAAALKGLSVGKHTLSDGSIWNIETTGAITNGK